MSVAFKEGLKIPPPAMNEIILSANQDIRQVTIRILNLNILLVGLFMCTSLSNVSLFGVCNSMHICIEFLTLFVQVLHNLSMWTAGEKNLTYDQAKKDSKNAKKDFKLVRKSRTPTEIPSIMQVLNS